MYENRIDLKMGIKVYWYVNNNNNGNNVVQYILHGKDYGTQFATILFF